MLYCQEYDVPKSYNFEDEEAYKTYEPQIKNTINWLLETSLGKDAIKRQEANKFLITWLTGTPNITINADSRIITFIETNGELLMPFMGGWTKYSLDNNYSDDLIQCNKAAIETVIAFYRKNRGFLKKDKEVEKYEKLMDKGKLEEEIEKRLKK